ncbi:hypothetical protein FACS1894110_10340 [Spirochaetia bacterium]|nr:hypothetical protein FACS1894110_10340 [Spirochaetia bacterium]
MKTIHDQWELFNKIIGLLERHLGPKCEVVLHDLKKDYSSTIVDIRNGHITNRKIGDGGSNLGLEVLRGSVEDGDQFNYITYTRDNKILRSSSIYFKGDDNEVIGALCVNLDITQSLQYEDYLRQFNQFSLQKQDNRDENSSKKPEVKEIFTNSVQDLLEYLITESQSQIGRPVSAMTRADKLQFIRFLDQKGAFLITRSGDTVCEFLKISKYTLYRYLEIARGEREDTDIGDKDGGGK